MELRLKLRRSVPTRSSDSPAKTSDIWLTNTGVRGCNILPLNLNVGVIPSRFSFKSPGFNILDSTPHYYCVAWKEDLVSQPAAARVGSAAQEVEYGGSMCSQPDFIVEIDLVPLAFGEGISCMPTLMSSLKRFLISTPLTDRGVSASVVFRQLAISFTNSLLMDSMISLAFVSEHIL